MASGHVSDGIGHRHDGEAEGQRSGDEIDAAGNGHAAAEGDEDECPDELREIRFPILHDAFHAPCVADDATSASTPIVSQPAGVFNSPQR